MILHYQLSIVNYQLIEKWVAEFTILVIPLVQHRVCYTTLGLKSVFFYIPVHLISIRHKKNVSKNETPFGGF